MEGVEKPSTVPSRPKPAPAQPAASATPPASAYQSDKRPNPAPIRQVSDVPSGYAPDADRADTAPGRVSREERAQAARDAANRTGVANNPRKGRKRTQTSVAVGQGRAERTPAPRRRQRNADYREKMGMDTPQGLQDAVAEVNASSTQREQVRVRRERQRLIQAGGTAREAGHITPRGLDELGAATTENSRDRLDVMLHQAAQKLDVPAHHLDSFVRSHPALKQLPREDAIRGVWQLNNSGNKDERATLGRDQLIRQIKDHSLNETDRELSADEGRARGVFSRSGQKAITDAINASRSGIRRQHNNPEPFVADVPAPRIHPIAGAHLAAGETLVQRDIDSRPAYTPGSTPDVAAARRQRQHSLEAQEKKKKSEEQ